MTLQHLSHVDPQPGHFLREKEISILARVAAHFPNFSEGNLITDLFWSDLAAGLEAGSTPARFAEECRELITEIAHNNGPRGLSLTDIPAIKKTFGPVVELVFSSGGEITPFGKMVLELLCPSETTTSSAEEAA